MSDNPYQAQIDELRRRITEAEALASDPDLAELVHQEVLDLKTQLTALEDAAALMEGNHHSSGSESGPITLTNAIFELRPGAGGDEAKIWANDLLRMYIRFCERVGLKFEYIDDLIIKVKGKITDQTFIQALTPDNTPLPAAIYPFEVFRYESGVHRVQRVPATEAQGRVHTSTASIAVLPEIPASHISIREEDLEWQFMRSGGAGGQSVNKTNSAVRLIHGPSGIAVTARQERKQAQNREIALELLRAQLWEIEEEKRESQLGAARSAIGRAQRAEKIRTYNYPQNRVTDHRIGISWYNLSNIVEGLMEGMFKDIQASFNSPDGSTPTATDDDQANSAEL